MKRNRLSIEFGNQDGAAAVEFAILVLPLTLFIVGIMMFGFIFSAYLEITHVAREGVRWAALQESESEIKTAALNTATGVDDLPGIDDITEDDIVVTFGPAPGGPLPVGWADSADFQGEAVHVTVTYNISGIKAFFGGFGNLFGPDTITSSATQRVE